MICIYESPVKLKIKNTSYNDNKISNSNLDISKNHKHNDNNAVHHKIKRPLISVKYFEK